MGAPWALDDHNETIRCAKLFYRAHYLQVFYDLIPISVPEVVAAPLIPHFARAMAAMSIYADHIYAISRYSKERSHRYPSAARPCRARHRRRADGGPRSPTPKATWSPAPAEVLAKLGVEGTIRALRRHAGTAQEPRPPLPGLAPTGREARGRQGAQAGLGRPGRLVHGGLHAPAEGHRPCRADRRAPAGRHQRGHWRRSTIHASSPPSRASAKVGACRSPKAWRAARSACART